MGISTVVIEAFGGAGPDSSITTVAKVAGKATLRTIRAAHPLIKAGIVVGGGYAGYKLVAAPISDRMLYNGARFQVKTKGGLTFDLDIVEVGRKNIIGFAHLQSGERKLIMVRRARVELLDAETGEKIGALAKGKRISGRWSKDRRENLKQLRSDAEKHELIALPVGT